MSFSIYLSSGDGTRVAGSLNQITYNVAFEDTPKHNGAYEVSMVFTSNVWNVPNVGFSFKTMYVNANLGVCDSFTPVGLYTGTLNNQVLGSVELGSEEPVVKQSQTTPGANRIIGTASIPANSGTVAYTLTESIVQNNQGILFQPLNRASVAYYDGNRPIRLNTKPTNNQFTVTLTNADGSLHTDFSTAPLVSYYGIILTFEALPL